MTNENSCSILPFKKCKMTKLWNYVKRVIQILWLQRCIKTVELRYAHISFRWKFANKLKNFFGLSSHLVMSPALHYSQASFCWKSVSVTLKQLLFRGILVLETFHNPKLIANIPSPNLNCIFQKCTTHGTASTRLWLTKHLKAIPGTLNWRTPAHFYVVCLEFQFSLKKIKVTPSLSTSLMHCWLELFERNSFPVTLSNR